MFSPSTVTLYRAPETVLDLLRQQPVQFEWQLDVAVLSARPPAWRCELVRGRRMSIASVSTAMPKGAAAGDPLEHRGLEDVHQA